MGIWAGICIFSSSSPIENFGYYSYPYSYLVNAGIFRQNGNKFRWYPQVQIYLPSLVEMSLPKLTTITSSLDRRLRRVDPLPELSRVGPTRVWPTAWTSRSKSTTKRGRGCNIPREYYLKKINNKRNNYINSRLDKNLNAGKFKFMKACAKTYNIISQMFQVPIIRVYSKNVK